MDNIYKTKNNDKILKFEERIEILKNNLSEIEKNIFDKKIKKMSNQEIYKLKEILIRFDDSLGIKPI